MERRFLEEKDTQGMHFEVLHQLLDEKSCDCLNIYKAQGREMFYVQAQSEMLEGPFNNESECFLHIVKVLLCDIDRYHECYGKIEEIIRRM